MVLHCYVSIQRILKQRFGGVNYVTKPEDTSTITPAKDNSDQLLKVGETWRLPTSSSDKKSHKSTDKPLILRYITYYSIRHWSDSIIESISIIDGKSEKRHKVKGLKKFKGAEVTSSCNGLVLLTSSAPNLHIVVNPLSKESTTIICSPMMWHGRPCGFFYHPVAKEYRILAVLNAESSTEEEPSYEYRLYLFGSKIWRRTVNPYFHIQPSHRFTCGDREINGNPAIISGALHWLMQDIMVFEMTTEEFSIKPLPSEVQHNRGERNYTMQDLLVKEDRLCLFHVGTRDAVMDVWIMEDYEKWSWLRKYSVNLDWNILEYPMDRHRTQIPKLNDVRVLGIGKDELVIFWMDRGLFSYHLASNTVEPIPLKKVYAPFNSESYGRRYSFMTYSTALQA